MESELHMRARMQQGMKRAAEAAGSPPEAREPLPGGAGLRETFQPMSKALIKFKNPS